MRLVKFVVCVALVTGGREVATAASAYVVGGGQVSATVGSLQIIIDIAPELVPMAVGGVELTMTSTTPGFLKFTGATVHNPILGTDSTGQTIKRWEIALGTNRTSEKIVFLGASIFSPAMDMSYPQNPISPGSSEFLFATIDYEILQPSGSTLIDLFPTYYYGAFVNGYDFPPGIVTGTTINFSGAVVSNPEPATLAMAGMGLIGFVLRRRNGERKRGSKFTPSGADLCAS